jgi:signal transduction histidine kinase/CheY-like chemotaxis protein
VEVLFVGRIAARSHALQDLVERHGYRATAIESPADALQAARRRKPAVLLADADMHGMSGPEFARAVKSDPQLKDVAVILAVRPSEPDELIRSADSGADSIVYGLDGGAELLQRIEMLSAQGPVCGGGVPRFVAAERRQLADLLAGAQEQNARLAAAAQECARTLAHSRDSLAAMFAIAEVLNKARTQQEACEGALEGALQLPGVLAGWITTIDDSGNFNLLASRNLPSVLSRPGALEGLCSCRRNLLAGGMEGVKDILECERLRPAEPDPAAFRFHTSVPIWVGDRTVGLMNLMGSEGGLFNDEDKSNLYAVGNQLGVALERTRLREHLERLVDERTAKLVAEVEERKKAERRIRDLSEGLERRVQERTRALEAVNRELESFSYSVSHDLRAPLRHVIGYLHLLADELGDDLTPQARRHLDTAANAGRRMDTLIEDLLAFARTGRAELRETRIDLDEMARAVIRELELSAAGRRIAWHIRRLPAVMGDASMVRQVLVNLLSNAVKYTRPRAAAEIELGSAGEADGMTVLFVRDNGVGFDMEYADRLFNPFRRLHSSKEFEGNGIGLANVRRIVDRHGGRTWAESALERGATFYFTLKAVLPQTVGAV